MHLANLTFTNGINGTSGRKVTGHCVEVTADTVRTNSNLHLYCYCLNVNALFSAGPEYNIEDEFYFPELFLAKWFRENEKQVGL